MKHLCKVCGKNVLEKGKIQGSELMFGLYEDDIDGPVEIVGGSRFAKPYNEFYLCYKCSSNIRNNVGGIRDRLQEVVTRAAKDIICIIANERSKL